MKRLLTISLLFFSCLQAWSQCSCNNCPVSTPANVPVVATLNVSGSTNDILNQNGQRVCEVCIDLEHEAIREMDMELVAPNGSSVELMIDNSLAFGPLDFVTVCFLPCDQPVMPDPGNSDNWTASEFVQGNGPFTGTYYPSSGCLETDLSGSLNGTWTLNMLDNVFLFDGVLNDFEIKFADAAGITCQSNNGCESVAPCSAFAGNLPVSFQSFCEGDPNLNFNWTIDYSGGTEPDPALFGYEFIISENGIILDITDNLDLTSYSPGVYSVCGFSFLLDDEPLIPSPDGSLSISDIESDITNELYCADLTNSCAQITIVEAADASISGPMDVCAGELVEYLNDNHDANASYIWSIVSGSFSMFTSNADGSGVLVQFISGPGELCITEVNPTCGDVEDCIQINVEEIPNITLLPTQLECAGSTVDYIFLPTLDNPSNFNFTVTGGSIVALDADQISVQWDNTATNGSICYDYTTPSCNSNQPICYEANIFETFDDFTLAPLSDACQGDEVTIIGPVDPSITEYLWSVNGATIISSPSNMVNVELDEVGLATICLVVVNVCGPGNEVCVDTDVFAIPSITVPTDTLSICTFSSTLIAEATTNNSSIVEWFLISGNNGVIINEPSNLVTDVSFPETGLYEFGVSLTENGCSDTAKLVVNLSVIDFTFDPLSAVCQGEQVTIEGPVDPEIIEYIWTIDGGTILSTPGNIANVEYSEIGQVNLCLVVVTDCGPSTETCLLTEVVPVPSIDIEPDSLSICELSTTLVAEATLSNNSLIEWILISGDNNAIITDPNQLVTDVIFLEYGLYDFGVSLTENGCSDTAYVVVDLTDGIDFGNLNYTCTGTGTYTVNFELFNGNGPYLVDGIEIEGTIYNSEEILSGTGFSFTVTDQQGCLLLIEESYDCPCLSSAGTMDITEILEICIDTGLPAVGIHNQDDILDFNDTGAYFFHTNADEELGVVLGFNDTGEFFFDPLTMSPGISYFISYVVGNNNNGIPDESDVCLSVAPGVEVIFYTSPIVEIVDFQGTCQDTFNLSILENPVGGVWTLLSEPDMAQANVTDKTINMNLPGIYELIYSSSENDCTTQDTLSLEYWSIPDISNLDLSCSNDSFTVSFDIVNGTAPYFINGNEITGNNYTSLAFASGENYEFLISDINGCLSVPISGIRLCDCQAEAGTMSSEVISFCPDQGFVFSAVHNADAFISSNEIGIYVLHDNPSNALGNILDIQNDGFFEYDNSYGTDLTLYVSYVVGEEIQGNIDLNDPCLSVSFGQEVMIGSYPSLMLNIDSLTCEMGFILSAFSNGTSGNWDLVSVPNGANLDTLIISEEIFSAMTQNTGEYTISYTASNGNCDLVESLKFTIAESPSIENLSYLCHPETGAVIVNIDFTDTSDSIYFNEIWIGGTFFQDSFEMSTIDETITFSYGGDCTLEVDLFYSCDCETVNVENLFVCEGSPNIAISELVQSTVVGELILTSFPGMNAPQITDGTNFLLENLEPGVYELEFLINSQNPDVCQEVFAFNIEIENRVEIIPLLDYLEFCDHQSTIIKLEQFVANSNDGFFLNANGQIIDPEIGSQQLNFGSNYFSFNSTPGMICDGDVYEFEIYKKAPVNLTSLVEDISCINANDGVISLQDGFGNALVNAESIINNELSEVDHLYSNLAAGLYEVYVFNNDGCDTTFIIELTEPEATTVSLGDDLILTAGTETNIQAITNLLNSEIEEVSWSELGEALGVTELNLIQSYFTDSEISITIEDINGCIATDMIRIKILEEEIYIPNIFNPVSNPPNNVFSLQNTPEQMVVDFFGIYDRWGNAIHIQKNQLAENVFWDGKFKGKYVVPGVYVYLFTYSTIDGSSMRSGDISVIR